mgnify:CR=1 FL=1
MDYITKNSECNVCYTEYKNYRLKNCFWGCSFRVCGECISKLIRLSTSGIIQYKCPMCAKRSFNTRHTKLEDLDITNQQQTANFFFGKLCKRNDDIIGKIYDIYEDEQNKMSLIVETHSQNTPFEFPVLSPYLTHEQSLTNITRAITDITDEELLNFDESFSDIVDRLVN